MAAREIHQRDSILGPPSPVASCNTDYAILGAGWNGKKKKKLKLRSFGS
jgi:hypothetical protein